jgi:hypothetical protein
MSLWNDLVVARFRPGPRDQVEADLDRAICSGEAIRVIASRRSSALVKMVRRRADQIESHGAAVNILIAAGPAPRTCTPGISIRRLRPLRPLLVSEQLHAGTTSWFGADVSAADGQRHGGRRFDKVSVRDMTKAALVFEGLWRLALP